MPEGVPGGLHHRPAQSQHHDTCDRKVQPGDDRHRNEGDTEEHPHHHEHGRRTGEDPCRNEPAPLLSEVPLLGILLLFPQEPVARILHRVGEHLVRHLLLQHHPRLARGKGDLGLLHTLHLLEGPLHPLGARGAAHPLHPVGLHRHLSHLCESGAVACLLHRLEELLHGNRPFHHHLGPVGRKVHLGLPHALAGGERLLHPLGARGATHPLYIEHKGPHPSHLSRSFGHDHSFT